MSIRKKSPSKTRTGEIRKAAKQGKSKVSSGSQRRRRQGNGGRARKRG